MFRMIASALVALFLCLAPAVAQTCVSVDSVLERVMAAKREYRIIDAGSTLDRLKQMFVEAAPAREELPASRAIVIDSPPEIIVLYLVQDMACSLLVIAASTEAREVRTLVFGERI